MSMLRKRSAQHKIYIPSNARENQYLLAKVRITDEFLAKHKALIEEGADKPYEKLYRYLTTSFFNLCDEFNIETGHFIAKDKYARVRYCPERIAVETKQQVLFFYNPKYHISQQSFVDPTKLPKKITLVFLANGEDLRANAAPFHQKVMKTIESFCQLTHVQEGDVRVCDHQHITYDLFAKSKGNSTSQAHKLRAINARYQSREVALGDEHDELSYAVIDLPLTRKIQSLVEVNPSSEEGYNPLYNYIADVFTTSAKQQNLNNGAVIANGRVPFVRESKKDIIVTNGELQLLGYSNKPESGGFTCKWESDKLVDTLQLIFVAPPLTKGELGYGKFLHSVETSLESFAKKLSLKPDSDELMIRFHQHVGFYK